MKTFKSLAEILPYYNKVTNTYDFAENGFFFDVCFAFDLSIDSDINAPYIYARNINARNIYACDIYAQEINACDINAWNIRAWNISFFAVCCARETFVCKSITGRRGNAKYFCLDSEVKIEEVKK